MNKSFVLGALGLAMVAAGVVRAGAAGSATPKIGYVDLQNTLQNTKVGKAAKTKLEAEKAGKQKEVDTKKEQLKSMAAELEKQRVVLKPDAVAKREQEIQKLYVDLQQKFMELQQELAKKEAQLTADIFSKAQKSVSEIAKRDGYTMILEKNASLVYADPSLDITTEVNKKLDAEAK